MTRNPILRFLFAFTLLAACGLASPYTITRPVPEQTVEGSPLGAALPGVEVPIPLEVDLESEAEARSAGPVQDVTLEALRLDITPAAEPPEDTDDWDFVDSIVVHVESSAVESSLPRQEVARLDPTPDGVRRLELETDTSVNLRPYVEEGARLIATVRGRAPADDVSYDGVVILGLSFL